VKYFDPQAAYVRLISKVMERLGDVPKRDLCLAFISTEDALASDAAIAVGEKDYRTADRLVDELVVLERLKVEVCPPALVPVTPPRVRRDEQRG